MTDDPSADDLGTVDLSVVIPARDAAATLGPQLDALLAQEWAGRWEVVVVDNGSTDATPALVERYAAREPRVRLVQATERSGVAHCRNVGIDRARGTSVAMVDADDVVAPGWLPAMADALRDADFVTGPLDIEALNPTWVLETRGRAIASGPGSFFGLFPFAHSCNLGVRRALVRDSGGFDERLPAGEDIELSLRLSRAGVRLHFVDEALVHYRYRTSLRALWRQARAYGRVKPELARRARLAGLAVPRGSSWRGWLWLVRRVGLLGSRPGRAQWVWAAAGRVGESEALLRVPWAGRVR